MSLAFRVKFFTDNWKYREERLDRVEKALSNLINDVWNLHLNGRMTYHGDIWNRYKRIGNILAGKPEKKGWVKGYLYKSEKKSNIR